jgi:hypothetical protein
MCMDLQRLVTLSKPAVDRSAFHVGFPDDPRSFCSDKSGPAACASPMPFIPAGSFSGRVSINARKFSRSNFDISILSACARPFFSPRSQQSRWSCRYAPRPASFPLGSTRSPSGVRTMRINARFARVWRHPTQVRCGTCLTRLAVFFTTSTSLR